jgi:hypothetical protein
MGILDDAIREHLELKRAHGAAEDEIRRKEAEAFGPVRQDAAPAVADASFEEHTQLLAPDDAAALAEPGDATAAAEPVETAPELDPLVPAPEDPYAVHPGDSLLPDPDVPPAAEAGAGTLEPTEVDPGPAITPDHHHDEQHPALVDHDHIASEEHAPEPVFGHSAGTAETPTAPPPDAPLEPSPIDDPPVGDPPVEHPDIEEPPPRQSPEPAAAHEDQPIEPPDEDVLEETPEFLQDAPEHDRLWFEQKPPRDFDFGE